MVEYVLTREATEFNSIRKPLGGLGCSITGLLFELAGYCLPSGTIYIMHALELVMMLDSC